jgi:4-amino-4-deoxy-L-arabinose transferase-like glycosyltransferase
MIDTAVYRKKTRMLVRHRVPHVLAVLAGLGLLVWLGAYNQPYYPVTWLDEGFALQGPINLIRFGKYAMKSSEGFRVLDQPLIANGPGVALPIAAGFALFGVGLTQARMVMVVYLVSTALAFFALAKRMYGARAAVLSLFLLLAVPREGFLWFGRMALGNVPALGYFIWGCLLWFTSLERDRAGYAVGAGLLFGLAMVTKGQYGLIVPTLLVVALVDKVYLKQIGLKKVALALLAALGCLAVWYAVQLALVGGENFEQHLEAVRSSVQVTVFAFRPMRIPGSLWYLVRSGLPLFVVPGWLYAAWALRKRDVDSRLRLLPLSFVAIWLCWYVFASVGWHRYAFAPYAVGLLFAGPLVRDAFPLVQRNDWTRSALGQGGTLVRWGAALLVTAILVGGLRGFIGHIREITAGPDLGPQRFAGVLQDHVRQGALVESLEWELDVLADLNYHHPTNDWLDRMTAVTQFGEELQVRYDPSIYQPTYLIEGPVSRWTGFYDGYVERSCDWVAATGAYELYACRP